MKICGIICEYNPFHNGHAYLLERAKKESGCDALVCVMSGNFTQRGEPAFLGKYLQETYSLPDHRDAAHDSSWNDALGRYRNMVRG